MSDEHTSANVTDIYAGQKTSIRDTAKWMGVAYAAAAGVFIAGAPFSDIASLDCWRLALTIGATLIAFLAFLLALNEILKFIIGDDVFANQLTCEATKFIDDHAEDILPARFETYKTFLDTRNQARAAVRNTLTQLSEAEGHSGNKPKIEKLREDLTAALRSANDFDASLRPIISVTHLHLLQAQLNMMRYRLAWLTLLGVAAMLVAVWAAKPPKSVTSMASYDFAAELSYLTGCGQNGADLG